MTMGSEEPLRARLRSGLTVAMKARDHVAVAALRATLGAIDNAETVSAPSTVDGSLAIEQTPVGVGAADVARRVLTEGDIAGIVRDEATEREEAAAEYDRAGRPDRAQRLRAEACVLFTYLSTPGRAAGLV
jgi:uncharacterized protein YqeY